MASQIDTKEGRKWLKELLQSQEVTIFFKKIDGTEREMICTLSENKIPVEKASKNTGRKKSEDALAVFDVEKQDWRSFRWDSVTRIQFDL